MPKLVIVWNPAEITGTRTDEDPRVPGLRANAVSRLEALGYDVVIADETDVCDKTSDAEIYYGRAMTPDTFAAAKSIRWIQTSVAGMEGFWFDEIRNSDISITSVRGIYSDVIADHMYGLLLSLARGIQTYAKRQSLKTWEKTHAPVRQLAGATLGLVGLGGIGLEVAKRGHASGMRVIALDPSPKGVPDYVQAVFQPDQLHEFLPQADFVAVSVPHIGTTEHMFDADAFDKMKDGSYILNVGRGKVVSLEALTAAIQNGKLAGAGLDVLEEEPLPPDHPLWDLDNVIITPHCAGRSDYPYQEERRLDLLVENAGRYARGEVLLNIFDKEKGYVP